MKKFKEFDCVKMKWDIQRQIDNEFAGIPDEESNRIQKKRIAQNPILSTFLKKVSSSKKMVLKD
ncbi:MAG: hypothetical protein IIA61_00960 [Candidatus Marinimicrobia bacterium]|nr:hypothetical protein [Candidatus Neomarinimicrobiota bacterium]